MLNRTVLIPVLLLSCWLFHVPAYSLVLNFDSVIQQAMTYAHDVKIARADIKISRHRLEEARSLYYPSIDFRLYNEYVHVPDENVQGIVSVGSSVSTALASTYQHSVVASLNYTLYDFGAKKIKIKNARRELDIARLTVDRCRADLRFQVLEAYARALRLWRQKESASRILSLRKKIYRTAQQLKTAGTVDQRLVERAALKLAESLERADELAAAYQYALNDLAFFTGERYLWEQTAFSDLPEPEPSEVLPEAGRLPEIRAIEAELEIKRSEIEILQKEMLPRFVAYGAYRMYGNDTNSPVRSLNNLTERDATVSILAEWNLFSGFRDLARVRRLNAEIQRLRIEKDKRSAELDLDIRSSHQSHRSLLDRDDQWQRRQMKIRQLRETEIRLSQQRLNEPIAYFENEIDLVRHGLDLDLKKIDRAVAGLKLAFWREGQQR